METLVVGAALALVSWHVAKRYVPAWLPPVALRAAAALVIVVALARFVRSAPEPALTAFGIVWLLAGGASFLIRRWLGRSKEREARRAALHAARMQVRRRAPPPGPVAPTPPSAPTRGGPP